MNHNNGGNITHKTTSTSTTTTTIRINFSLDIFVSYHNDIESNVLEICEIITKYFTERLAFSKLFEAKYGPIVPFEKVCDLINVSKSVVCCITKAFFQTESCLNELFYAIKCSKPIVFILFESLSIKKIIDYYKLKIDNPMVCNLYLDLDSIETCNGKIYDEFILFIQVLMNSSIFSRKKSKNSIKTTNAYLLTYQCFFKNDAKYYKLQNNDKTNRCALCDKYINASKEQFLFNKTQTESIQSVANCVMFLKNFYHRHCFGNLKCNSCKINFSNTDKIYRDDTQSSFLCESCMSRKMESKEESNLNENDIKNCFECKKDCTDNYIKFKNRKYHQECFCCSICKTNLNEDNPGQETNNALICNKCLEETNKAANSKTCSIL